MNVFGTIGSFAESLKLSATGRGWLLQSGNRNLVVNDSTAWIAAGLGENIGSVSSIKVPKANVSPGIRALIQQFIEFYFFDSGSLSKNVNYARLVWPEADRVVPSAPASISYLITKRCNMKCVHCYNNSGQKDPSELPLEQRSQLAHYIGRWGVRVVTLTGGEPLLLPDIIPFMRILESHGVAMKVSTNGWYLGQEFLKLVESGAVFQVNISLDGSSAATHDTYRGFPGSFKRVLSSLDVLRRAGVRILSLNVSVYHRNLEELDQVCQIAQQFDVKSISFKPILKSGRPTVSQELLLHPEELDRFRGIRNQLREKYRNSFTVSAQILGANIQQEEEDDTDCGAGDDTMFIDSNGDMLPCESLRPFLSVPHIRDHSPIQVWLQHESFRTFREFKAKVRLRRAVGTTGCLATALERSDEVAVGELTFCSSRRGGGCNIPSEPGEKHER